MIIAIADDENLMRIYLKKIIKEMNIPDLNILEAKNGKELVSQCQNYPPDLAFVDIKMPLLNGLDAIREVKSRCPDTSWILLTGFSEFEYAVDAISLGVKEYLLKPINPEEMRNVIETALQELHQKRQNSNHNFELQVISSFNTYGMHMDQDTLALENGQVYTAFLFMENPAFKKKDSSPLYQSMLPLLHSWLSSWRTPQEHSALFCNQYGTLCLITRASVLQTNRARSYLAKLLGDFRSKAPVTVLACETRHGFQDLFSQCEALQQDLPYCIFLNPGNVYETEDLSDIKEYSGIQHFLTLLNDLIEAYQNKDEILYNRYLEKLQNNGTAASIYAAFQSPLLKFCRYALGIPFSLQLSYTQFCAVLKSEASSMYQQAPAATSNLIDRIKEYIQVNYANDVSIIALADTFNITPTYLSKFFHEKTGVKLIDYVSDVRIKNAKRIMCENPDILIKDVTLLVGYFSTRHFTNLFLKHVGIYPSEFQKQLKMPKK